MTDEMLELARSNVAKSGAPNVEFVKGQIEDIPLPGSSIDVIISNCVINLSRTSWRCPPRCSGYAPPVADWGSRMSSPRTDSVEGRAEPGTYVGRIAGALSRSEYLEYLEGLAADGFVDQEVVFTHEVAPGMHGSIVRAVKPIGAVDGGSA